MKNNRDKRETLLADSIFMLMLAAGFFCITQPSSFLFTPGLQPIRAVLAIACIPLVFFVVAELYTKWKS